MKTLGKVLGVSCFVIFSGWQPLVVAQGIYSNPISDPNPSASNPFTAGDIFDPNITVSGISRGPTVNANAGSNRFNATAWNLSNLDQGDYFSWTLTPQAGYEIDFTSLSGNWQRSGTGPQSYVLKTSTDNFASAISTGAVTGNSSAVSYSLDLSSLQHETSPIEFRLYAFGGTNSAGTFSINDFEFDGTVQQSSVLPPSFAGDYNGDGKVDAADYVSWRAALDTGATLASNETESLGVTDQADYDAWRANFGGSQVGGGAALSSSATTVPEPTSILLALIFGISASPMLRLRKS